MNIRYFAHPIPLLAVVIMALNDHFLKWHYPSWWTGKLSDFAGIFFFPLFLCALINTVRHYLLRRSAWITRQQLLAAIVLTDIVFAGIKLNPTLADLYIDFVSFFGIGAAVTQDTTDLVALGMNILTWRFALPFFDRSPEMNIADVARVIPARNDEVV